jgi:hypothetical protein
MQPKAFEKSMYYPMLADVAEEVRYRLVSIEIKCCSCGVEYERGSKCPICGEEFNGDEMRRKMAKRLIWCGLDASDAAPTGGRVPIYLPEGRVHCNFDTCDNYFTISQQAIERHRYCPAGHELPRPANLSNYFKAARHYDRLRQHPCPHPQCGLALPAIPWCPCCRAQGIVPAGRALSPQLTIMWVFNTVGGVSLDDPLREALAAGIPDNFVFDAQP